MKMLIVLLLALTGVYSLPLNKTTETTAIKPTDSINITAIKTTESINTAAIKNISDAILYATYVGQDSADIAARLHGNDTNPSICFIKPRKPNSDTPPLDRLKEDRPWLESLYNYTSKVNREMCQDLRKLDENKSDICVEIMDMLNNMNKLKTLLDEIIRPDEEGAGDGVDTPIKENRCWDTTPVQQYWNFLELHSLAIVYIRKDLEDLQRDFVYKK